MEKGFTIIELIISIFILSVAVVGVFSAFSIVVILTADAADRLTATYLAQEGMEIVRNIRDTNWLNIADDPSLGRTWLDGLADTGIPSVSCSACKADFTDNIRMYRWTNDSSDYLKINENNFYNYTNGMQTKFKRKIIIAPLADGDASLDHIIKVSVQVSWDEKANILNASQSADNCNPKNCITAESTLYDWY